jgi:malate dehydrogenase
LVNFFDVNQSKLFFVRMYIIYTYRGRELMKGKRVGIVGAGNVGATVAYSLAMQGSAHEIILRDNKMDRAMGMALDMSQAANAARSHTVVSVAKNPSDLKDCDVVVVTAGSPRLPGMSRDELLAINAKIMEEVAKDIKEYSPNAIIIPVSNPLDAMVYVALKKSGFDRSRVVGMAGVLDSARMAHFIYEKLGYGAGQIRASVMGGHGDTMVPLPRFSTVAGVPLTDLLNDIEIEEIVNKTKNGGAEIVGYLKNGSAYYAPAKATSIMVDAILKDTKQIHPCAVMLDGEYGYSDVVAGVPVILGASGVEKVIETNLNDEQKSRFEHSVESVRELIRKL